ncbi:hypothetical protein [Xanthocytophaga agilis]|uniref:Uncharacterized protein n=1 Tax=Xanthocytophaga agilis TaxID=3048010 RepID=A0AAE3R622_9BACT|nr:hypothetical protein [Xanthocytophaga agilis]MDJ1504419.1 hypothetical protein [Xanthocytophaga agilis]
MKITILKNALIIAILSFSISCKQKQSSQPIRHKDLLGFKSEYIAEYLDDKYQRNKIEQKLNVLKVRYIEDIIYVSTYAEANGCGGHFGNMKIRNNTIVLTYDFSSDTTCTSMVIDKLTYLINNPGKKKRKIKFE